MSRELISDVHIYHQENDNAVKLIFFLQIHFFGFRCMSMRPIEDTIYSKIHFTNVFLQ